MTESILALVPTFGLPFLFGIAVLAASGVSVSSTLSVLVAGAIIGDQIGYQIGFRAGNVMEERLARKPSHAKQVANSKEYIHRFGGIGVFLTRWLLSPIGPITNVVCGASNIGWVRFAVWDILGEIVWVAIYTGIGYAFRGNLKEIAALLGQVSWLLIVALVAVFMGIRLLAVMRKHNSARTRV